jgi:hypothetical protein
LANSTFCWFYCNPIWDTSFFNRPGTVHRVIVLHTWLFYAKCVIELIKLIFFSYQGGGFTAELLVNGILAIGAHILLSSAILFSSLYFVVASIQNMDNPIVSNVLRYGLAVLKVACVGLLAYKVPVFALI